MKRQTNAVPSWIIVVACALAALVGGFDVLAAQAPSDDGPSEAIYPPQRITIRFNHQSHLGLGGMTCTSCHQQAKTSAHSSDSLLPQPKLCDGCHGTDHTNLSEVTPGPGEMGTCQFCHVDWQPGGGSTVARMIIPKPNLHFSHKAHADRNIGCAQCHDGVEKSGLATRSHLPRMQDCLRCHQMPEPAAGGAKSDCATCHLTQTDGTLKTTFPSGELKPPQWMGGARHTADFILRHRFVAAENSQLCTSCHQEDFCAACHDGRVRPRSFHPNDWLSMHAIAAFQDSPRCTSCHNEQTFCMTCHQRAGVTMSGPNQAQGRRFHPPGWADFRNRGPGHHAWEAQRNLNACVSCHTERDCAMCHASPGRRGLGVNPHGAGFVSRCASALRRNPRPCLVCHEPGSPQLDLCR